MDRSVDDVMPKRDGPENLRILKRRQLRLDYWGESWVFDRLGMQFSFSYLDWQRWIEILDITRYAARWNGVSIVWSA